MDIGFLLILVIIGIAVSIAASYILKLNPGVVALAFAYLIGCFGLDMSVRELVSYWPTSIVFRLMSLTMFFSFAV